MATLAVELRPLLLSLPATPFGVAVEVEEVVMPLGEPEGVVVCVTMTLTVEPPVPETDTVTSLDDGGGVVVADDGLEELGGVVDEGGLLVVWSGDVVEEVESGVEDGDELDEVDGGGSVVGGEDVGGGAEVELSGGGVDDGVELGGSVGVEDGGDDVGGGSLEVGG